MSHFKIEIQHTSVYFDKLVVSICHSNSYNSMTTVTHLASTPIRHFLFWVIFTVIFN